MFNTTKALLTLIIVAVTVCVVSLVWIVTPQNSGVAMATLILGIPLPGVLIGWVHDA